MDPRSIDKQPLIVLIGPTASGKTALAIELAVRHRGELICADSRTVFREMNIGTAKPTKDEQKIVPHWGIDLTDPGQRYTAAAFQRYAYEKIGDIRRRGKLPIIVGGTGLYIDGVIYDYSYPDEPTAEDRQRFEAMTTDELHSYCVKNNIELPLNDKNKRHLIRSVVHKNTTPHRLLQMINNTYVYGIAVDKSTLRERIERRTEHMFEDGVVDEARKLGEKYGWESESMTGNIYPLLKQYLEKSVSLAETKRAFTARDWQLAKRQMTWFRRNPEIAWGSVEDISNRVNDVLASGQNI